MASVDWRKLHSVGEVKAVLRHDCQDSREAAATHANEDIQRDMTRLNTGVLDGYTVTARAYDERMAELPPPVRKDAVVGLGFSIPMPEGLPEEKEDEWSKKVYALMADAYGKKNLVCFVTHRDERHEYIDPDTKERRISRPHIQGVLVPESDGRLCAKEVTSRAKMTAINRSIHEMTQRDYGLDFMDGSRAKSRGSVETLKQRSALAALEARNRELETRNAELEKQVDGWGPKMVYKKAQQRREDAERAADEAEARQAEAEARRAEAEAERDRALQAAAEARRSAQEARQRAEEYTDKVQRERAAMTALEARTREQVAKAERLRDYWEKAGKTEPGTDGVLRYLRLTKTADGSRTLYDDYRHRAVYHSRQVSQKQEATLDGIIADATQRTRPVSRPVPRTINHVQEQDDELSL